MAARGSLAKSEITEKILATFENSFLYDKEIRIPVMENGELVQIKCVLTCAKVNVENSGDTVVPGSIVSKDDNVLSIELTEQEKKETADLLASLNL